MSDKKMEVAVARALAHAKYRNASDKKWLKQYVENTWQDHLKEARVAIEAVDKFRASGERT